MTEPTYKTRYLRDPKNPERVVTLVTKVEGNVVSFATAVNSPPRRMQYLGLEVVRLPGDRFTRKTGSMIARGRLDSGRPTHVVKATFDPATQHPFVVALNQLSTLQNSVARVAKHELEKLHTQNAMKMIGEADKVAYAEVAKAIAEVA